MLDHLGEPAAAAAILKAIETVLPEKSLRTPDLAGTATTITTGKAIAAALS
jgi:tartrate dehydrogenase/decarboxylase/D-malate dehydrogenase